MNAFFSNALSPHAEMVSYETLWGMPSMSLKSISELFKKHQVLPSQLLDIESSSHLTGLDALRDDVERFLAPIRGFSVSVHGCFQYPQNIRDAKYPPELLYYRGNIGLMESPCVSIVGTRKATDDGKKRAEKLARSLTEAGYTIVSGLAAGIDTAAMSGAISAGGRTIGVIGTPINEAYPKENKELQEWVASCHLLLSQVPFYRYSKEPFAARRRYFPERNETMAAISQATIIVEASEGSGTLTQARACLQQGRKLFILNSCFERSDIQWPHTYENRGAIRVRDMDDIMRELSRTDAHETMEENRNLDS
jgi:DNA processing protein